MKNFKILVLSVLLLGAGFLHAQGKRPKVVKVETIPVKAEVVGVLQDNKLLAVLRILEVDSNDIGLKVDEEVLVEFHFTTKPVKNEPKMSGVSGDEIIAAQMDGKYNPRTKQYDYRIFRYRVTSKLMEVSPTKAEGTKE